MAVNTIRISPTAKAEAHTCWAANAGRRLASASIEKAGDTWMPINAIR